MTTSSINYVAAATTIIGNQITVRGNAITAPYTAGSASGVPISAVAFKLMAVGGVHGFVNIPIADPETLEGALMPADLQSAQIALTQGASGASIELIAEEIYSY